MMEANEPCDLRLVPNSAFRTVFGGYITASPYHRQKGFSPNTALERGSIGCMDVRSRSHPIVSTHAHS